jgi:hypothetical protein
MIDRVTAWSIPTEFTKSDSLRKTLVMSALTGMASAIGLPG